MRLIRNLALLLVLCAPAWGQVITPINCATGVICSPGGPQDTKTGDKLPDAGAKINGNFTNVAASIATLSTSVGTLNTSVTALNASVSSINASIAALPPQLFTGTALPVNKGGTGLLTVTGPLKGNGTSAISPALAADIAALWSGGCSSTTFLRGDGACVTPSGSGTVTTTGSPATGNLAKFSGATSVVNADLSGDVTTSGGLAATVVKVNGASVPVTAPLLASNGSGQLTPITLGNNLAISAGVLGASQGLPNAQTGTTYAMLTTDAGKFLTFCNAAPIAVSLSQATTAGFGAGYAFDVQNICAGDVTITPAVSTINGRATLVIHQNQGCSITSDGTAFQVLMCTAVMGNNLTQAANTSLDGFTLIDSTPASAGNQQYSPRIRWTGQGWKTTATAASQPVDWISELQPVQGTTSPTANLVFSAQINGGGYSNLLSLGSGVTGALIWAGTGTSIYTGAILSQALRVNGTNSTAPAGTGLYAATAGTSPTSLGFGVAGASVGTWTASAFTPTTPIISGGTPFTVASGTGACATNGTIVGGAVAGKFTCTGTTGASTVTLTLVAAPHEYSCVGRDVTTPTTLTQTGAVSPTSVTLTLTSVAANDVIQFQCIGY